MKIAAQEAGTLERIAIARARSRKPAGGGSLATPSEWKTCIMPPGIDGLPDWAISLFYVCAAIGAAFVMVRSMMKGAGKVTDGNAADRAVTAISSVQPYSDRITQDALITAIGDLHETIIKFHETVRLMADRLDRDRDERKLREDLQQEHDLSDLKNIIQSMRKDQAKG